MIELSSYSNQGEKHFSEIIGIEPTPLQKPRLPRHISPLESRTYNRYNLRVRQQPKVCPLAPQSSTDNVAWNILKYQLSDRVGSLSTHRPCQEKHLENVRSNLKHRLAVARVRGDERLVEILQEEFRQLEARC